RQGDAESERSNVIGMGAPSLLLGHVMRRNADEMQSSRRASSGALRVELASTTCPELEITRRRVTVVSVGAHAESASMFAETVSSTWAGVMRPPTAALLP